MLGEALEDARQAAAADASYAKAHFRQAQSLLALGRESDPEMLGALHATWKASPEDPETHRLLLKHDERFGKFTTNLEAITSGLSEKREQLTMMVSRGHPMSLRTRYYATWMKHWTAHDRETALSEAFLAVVEQLKNDMKKSARSRAIWDKRDGKVGAVRMPTLALWPRPPLISPRPRPAPQPLPPCLRRLTSARTASA